ncbi:hypothetical protein [Secundilactobacillus silagei]|uniref:Uncharacterized protein n=1 Tax=Secundilactobacillus silagei JCM 19001 TaxID=1302250 RepID=A0A1Z5II94_9LACO|nr:hypothetical protein [Secundilactobacillus silagei]TDG67466.1 hypothetical protein C5L25_001062 [Secundilactobacillus silagei JCM 19001]GAX01409.1 hypothetical protein IWT126_01437 [Secundilactobacillus silagei JCM 19001]
MLFGEITLKELISSYLNLLRNSRQFLKESCQIDIILHLKDEAHDREINVRNEQLKQAEQLRIRRGRAAIEVLYRGTQLKAYQAFVISDQRYKPKYFVGWMGNQKVDKDYFISHIEPELKQIAKPYVNGVIFPGLFV